MAQFDIHRNTGRQGETIPFVVVVQSSLGPLADTSFNPSFTIDGIDVVLHPLEIVSIPAGQMGVRLGSLSDAGDQIIQAIDQLLSRAWK